MTEKLPTILSGHGLGKAMMFFIEELLRSIIVPFKQVINQITLQSTKNLGVKQTIMNPTGKVVHTETESFDGAGKHFFYFNGKDVPTGTYYYTIESPIGVLIVKQTLLIVK